MVSKTIQDSNNAKIILKEELNISDISEDDIKILSHVCNLLSERAGLLVAMPMGVFIDRMHWKDHVAVAVTGSLYKHHPTMKNLLEKYIGRFVPKRSFHTFLSDDGSGKGAGLVAAIAARRL